MSIDSQSGVLLNTFLRGHGWRSEWCNDLGNIVRIDAHVWLYFFSLIIEKRYPMYNFSYYEPFYRKDRSKGRRLYLKNLYRSSETEFMFSEKLEGDIEFMGLFEPYFEKFRFGEWYTFHAPLDYRVLPKHLDTIMLTKPNTDAESFFVSVAALTWVDRVYVRERTAVR